MRRTAATVAEFARAARALGAGRVRIVATSAVREAANREEFVARLERESGERVEVVSGEEEARLTLKGVTSGLPGLGGSFVLFDIGGGSTEFVLARGGDARGRGEPAARRGRAPGRMGRAGAGARRALRPPAPARGAAARGRGAGGHRGRAGRASWWAPRAPSPRWPRSSSGSPPTTRRPSTATASSAPRWSGSSRGWARSGWQARGRLPCLEPGRADVIIPGIAICLAAMARCGRESLVVSDRGLREGILCELLGTAA